MPDPAQSGSVIDAREGWVHLGCPSCGHVEQWPVSRLGEHLWCPHNGRFVWGADSIATGYAWTRAVRVSVALDEESR